MPDSVPEGWRQVRLGDVLGSALGGGTPARDNPAYWGGSIPWATVKDMRHPVLDETEEAITPAGVAASSTRVIPAGTVLLATRMAVGAIAWAKCDTAINQDLKALIPGDSLDPRFLFQLMLARRPMLEAAGTGTTVKGVSIDFVRGLELLLPPLPEQRAIAAVLDAVDDTIERTEAVIAATEDLRCSLLHELLTRGVPGMHSEWKHVPGLGTVPACWEATTLGECLADVEAGRSPLAQSRPARADEWGVLKVSSVSWGLFQPDENKALTPGTLPDPRFEVQPGDVILSRANTPDLVGRAILVRATRPKLLLSDKTLRLVPDPARIVREFLLLALSTPSSRAQISGSASGSSRSMFNVSQEALRRVNIALPPRDEQERISATLEAVDLERDQLGSLREHTFATKAALADALLSGARRVPIAGTVK